MDPQLEQALEVSEKDVKDASAGVLQDLRRFQKDKEADLRRYMVCISSPPDASAAANSGSIRLGRLRPLSLRLGAEECRDVD